MFSSTHLYQKKDESENVIQRYSKRPRQLGKLCLADYVSKVDVTYLKGNKISEKVDDTNDDDSFVNSSNKVLELKRL